MNEMRTETLQFRVAPKERGLIEKCAKKSGMTVSEYARVCILMEMVIEGEPEALKIVLKAIGTAAMDSVRAKLRIMESLRDLKS
jgi:uncharacterized protein (DUF1778 family)